jgi:small GTP-binding protein
MPYQPSLSLASCLQASESSVVQQLTVQVWDTAGQEQFHSLTSTYYRKAGGVMVMYDSSNRASYDSLRRWLEDVDSNSEGVVKMIVATKSDVPSVVPESEGKAFAAQNGCLFGTTSAKAGNGVIPAFQVSRVQHPQPPPPGGDWCGSMFSDACRGVVRRPWRRLCWRVKSSANGRRTV